MSYLTIYLIGIPVIFLYALMTIEDTDIGIVLGVSLLIAVLWPITLPLRILSRL